MPQPDISFQTEEYLERVAKVHKEMEARGLDLLIATDPSNMAWLSGYDGWSFYTHQAVIVPLGDTPIWWGRMMDSWGAELTVWLPKDRIIGYPDIYVQNPKQHPHSHLADLLKEKGLAKGRIGVELDNYYYSAKAHQELTKGLPDAQIVDATALVNWQRAVKSKTELAYMRRAARIVERMHDRIIEVIEPGMRKNELIAEIYDAGIRGTPHYGGDYPAIVPLAPSGIDATAPHLTWNDWPIRPGEGTFFEIAGCHRRYHVPLCRTIWLGEPPDEVLRAEAALLEGLENGIDAARAGNRACDIAHALYDALGRAGIERDGRCGYPIGISYPPDWGERTISIRKSDETVLEPGMTFHFMPGLWMDEWGLEITESIVIQEAGPALCIADYPRELFVKR
ncbi:ectoine hydrolase DoeA [Paracoccaceae bacterium GXU_MW_L88]